LAVTTTQPTAPARVAGSEARRRRSDALWGYFFIAPQLIGLLVFSLIPLLGAIAISLMDWDGLGQPTFIGLQNFVGQFSSDLFRKSMLNTAYYTLLAVPIGVALSLLVAVGVNKVRGKTFYRLFYFMPVVTSTVAVATVWLYLLNGEFGPLNGYLRSIFGINPPNWLVDEHWVIPVAAAVSIWQGLGFNMVIFLAGLQGIGPSYREAASIDGANALQQFRHVTLPLLSPTIFFVTIISIIGSLQVFDVVLVMFDGGPGNASRTVVYHLYDLAFRQFNFGASSAAAVILFATILAVTLFQLWAQRRWVHYDD
jgi:multiple sugar transport system permease protein